MTTASSGTRSPTQHASWRSRGLAAALDYAQASHARAVAVLVALTLLAFLPGFFQIPPIDRDEARFAQATKQMVENGDYVDIRFQNEVRYKKPIGIYWLQAAIVKTATRISGHEVLPTIWLYRLPSLLGAIGAVLLTYWTALAFVTRRTALVAAAMLASCVLLGVEARLAKTDAMLLFTTLAAMGAMARVYLPWRRTGVIERGWTNPAIFWTAMAGGILLKGPLIVMFVGFAAVTLVILDRKTSDGSWRWLAGLRPAIGLLWMVALVLPWFVAIIGKAGDSFFAKSVGDDMLAKVTSGQEAHGAPPLTYLLLFFVTFWPGSVLAAMAVPAVRRAWRQPGTQFLLAWLVPSWIVLELVVTKLPHYVLPLYPAIAILIAGALEAGVLSRARWLIHGTIGWFLFAAVICLAAFIGLVLIDKQLGFPAWPFAAAAIIMALMAWWLYETDGPERAVLRAVVSSVLIAITIYGVVMPSMSALFPSVSVANALRASSCEKRDVVAVGFQEPSLVFLVGSNLRFVDANSAADFLFGGSCRFAVIDARLDRNFAQRADTIGLRYSQVQRIDGYNISVGKPVTLAIYQSDNR
ncbi:MAG: glycosyltransferase family 39 protein [Pseudolabrys sp.]|nr:glycosyltransferase family 39 protein [Pseudolabrys sp.]